MSLETKDLKVPIHFDEHGTARIGGTRVTLHTLIGEFRNGATPEQIRQDFDSLTLADIYAVIADYLNHRDEVDAHLREQDRRGDEVQRKMEALDPSQGVRGRRLARRKETA